MIGKTTKNFLAQITSMVEETNMDNYKLIIETVTTETQRAK